MNAKPHTKDQYNQKGRRTALQSEKAQYLSPQLSAGW